MIKDKTTIFLANYTIIGDLARFLDSSEGDKQTKLIIQSVESWDWTVFANSASKSWTTVVITCTRLYIVHCP